MTRSAPSLKHEIRSHFSISDENGRAIARFKPSSRLPLGLTVHEGEVTRAFRIQMGKSTGTVLEAGRTIEFGNLESAHLFVDDFIDRLVKIAAQPLSIRTVEKLLAITPRERLQWTKSGLLPVSGSAQIMRGSQPVTLPTYSPFGIELLLEKPDIIAKWRAADAT